MFWRAFYLSCKSMDLSNSILEQVSRRKTVVNKVSELGKLKEIKKAKRVEEKLLTFIYVLKVLATALRYSSGDIKETA